MPPTSGNRLGPYELIERIGAGGMGEVWKARDTRLDRIVAVKLSKTEFSQTFEREARAIAAVNHPNICHIYDVGPNYLVMEHLEGRTLSGPLPLEEALRIAVQIAGALEAAHVKSILHRDLKPANIMITPNGAKLLDFGLARVMSASAADALTTIAGTITGTAAYMSPEQAQGMALDERSDVFSFGAVLYEMLSGARAFGGDSVLDTLNAVVRDEPAQLHSPAADIVKRCMAKPPAQRFQKMMDVRKALALVSGEPARSQPSIAVLPFADMSAAKDNEYFSDGLAEEIINALAHLPDLKVIARTSAFAFKGQNTDIRRIAETLGVSNILEGSVRKSGNRIRVTAQLITAADGSHLWSERYDRDLADVFAVQDEISQAIAAALKVKLGRRKSKHTPVAEAYQAYLEGRYHLLQATPAGMRRAIDCLQRAIRIDPSYAPAQAALAERIYFQTIYLGARPCENVPAALAAVEDALRIDPDDSAALAMRGAFHSFYEYNWRAAGEDTARAIEMDPGNSRAHVIRAAWHLLPLGRFEEALAEVRRAVELDPLGVPTRNLEAWALYSMSRSEEAVAVARRLLELFPGQWTTCSAAANVLRSAGYLDEAVLALARGLEINPGNVNLLGSLALIRGSQGQAGEAVNIRAQLELMTERGYVPFQPRSLAHEGCGDMDRAYELMSDALDEREPMAMLFFIFRRAEFESDSRYQALLRKVNLS
jgi:eukaryotic-like serine/threonine-protein kinase